MKLTKIAKAKIHNLAIGKGIDISKIRKQRISPNIVILAKGELTPYESGLAVAQAQLDDDLKEAQEKVGEIFEEIEGRLFTHDGDGSLILTSAPPRDRIVAWWQAFKQKHLELK